MWSVDLGQLFELATKYYGTDWAAMFFTFAQLYLLGNGKRAGFIFGILATISWASFGIMAGSVANPIANFIFLVMNLRGLLKWKATETAPVRM
ncbi:MAG: nicotinamide mononucleotide transporter [Henriciella sp.]|nr:nicotinamide mononucleotide transporter [Henriciella sp.]